ncbi:MAG TPA: T9SS type A sorting domain-containing protein [Draconibacterium sp.]|nr:T9SS type A sorting domain-containing protein [Draconibacterium sp.]
MKTSFTFKNRVAPRLLFLFSLVLLVSTSVFGTVKHSVIVTNYKFSPAELQIEIGDTVEWKNTQGFHNVNGTNTTFPSNPESFGNSTGTGWTYTYVFKTAGKYDYQCDPHAAGGMTGKIEVNESGGNEDGKYDLTINFTGMTPHVGQTLWLEVVEKSTGKEVERKAQIISVEFSVVVSGIEADHSYFVNFYADHNNNGKYDIPPVDHAWKMELNNVSGNSTLDFAHNINFTNIEWKNKLTVHFMNMTPHVGQTLKLAVVDKNTGVELGRTTAVAAADFMIDLYGIEKGKSYNIDFYADHNKNGYYNAPSTDHAWRMELNNVNSDTTLNFTHNTSFTNIEWKNELGIHFMGMTPHVGQNLWLSVIDKETGISIDTVITTVQVEFMINVVGTVSGKSYDIDFYTDHNNNGKYDVPPADHAWRISLDNVMADTMLIFMHNISFTDIFKTTSSKTIQDLTLRMYPNPATNRVYIEQTEIAGSESLVSIYDITGKLKYQEVNQNSSNKIEIDIHNLSNGIYFLDVRTNNKQKMLKLIKY